MGLVLTSPPFVPWPHCHHGAGFQQFIYVLGAPTPVLFLWARWHDFSFPHIRLQNSAFRCSSVFQRSGAPNRALHSDPACIAFRSLSATRFLGFAQRLGAGGAGELHSLGAIGMPRFLTISNLPISALALSLSIFASSSCKDACANKVIFETVSPNGELKAVVFQRDCGATTGFSTQVSILKAGSSFPNISGNVFVADCDHGRAVAGPGGGPTVEVHWSANNALELAYDFNARVFSKQTRLSSVNIQYKALSVHAPNTSFNPDPAATGR